MKGINQDWMDLFASVWRKGSHSMLDQGQWNTFLEGDITGSPRTFVALNQFK